MSPPELAIKKLILTVLDLAKLKMEDSVYFLKRVSPKLIKRYNYNVIIVEGR
jgi:hypothetical protein